MIKDLLSAKHRRAATAAVAFSLVAVFGASVANAADSPAGGTTSTTVTTAKVKSHAGVGVDKAKLKALKELRTKNRAAEKAQLDAIKTARAAGTDVTELRAKLKELRIADRKAEKAMLASIKADHKKAIAAKVAAHATSTTSTTAK